MPVECTKRAGCAEDAGEETMTRLTRFNWVALMLLVIVATTGRPGAAQTDAAANFPNKPIRVIVPFAAGGGNDIFARVVGQKLGEILGQTLVIENRPNAGGRPAAEFVTTQPADGYMLFVGAS